VVGITLLRGYPHDGIGSVACHPVAAEGVDALLGNAARQVNFNVTDSPEERVGLQTARGKNNAQSRVAERIFFSRLDFIR
jgi:hypothetical protein